MRLDPKRLGCTLDVFTTPSLTKPPAQLLALLLKTCKSSLDKSRLEVRKQICAGAVSGELVPNRRFAANSIFLSCAPHGSNLN